MFVLSIIACRMFEDELVYMIEKHGNFAALVLVEDENSTSIARKLDQSGCTYNALSLEKVPEFIKDISPDSTIVVIHMLELALHAIPENLRSTVYGKIEQMSAYSQTVLLFYGLCGNVLRKVETEMSKCACPVYILKEENGEIVDDCIGAVLGGRAAYLSKLKSFRGIGTFFMTPMWAANWKEMIMSAGITNDPDNIKMAKYVFDYAGYKKVAKLNTGLVYEQGFDDRVEEFARKFNFEIIEMDGNLDLIEKCFCSALARRKEIK
ncbi:Protein of unknown function (DUF1638) [Methanomethylovorans hollandica DSM 15978]|uniref:DUF1638 domain-containing protein n=1 Tax=Methanomethylovorans hollandica (strain DSM 15978 / NBRC 107637 / DMS1) TaxID=867904 RepID=L0KWQ5_METHD|nr:DUF1638 domain-containing protein [Methanomethylovorans hollandica]AGB49566.1 Protein of unknown function (DUF1638) [Methanomethylovorans hollandica DSM 15978]